MGRRNMRVKKVARKKAYHKRRNIRTKEAIAASKKSKKKTTS